MHLKYVQASNYHDSLKVALFRHCQISWIEYEVWYRDYIDSYGVPCHEVFNIS